MVITPNRLVLKELTLKHTLNGGKLLVISMPLTWKITLKRCPEKARFRVVFKGLSGMFFRKNPLRSIEISGKNPLKLCYKTYFFIRKTLKNP